MIGGGFYLHRFYISDEGVSNLQTQINNLNSMAIVNITRNGTTFTATRANGTSFTFTQQDDNTTYPTATTTRNGLMTTTQVANLNALLQKDALNHIHLMTCAASVNYYGSEPGGWKEVTLTSTATISTQYSALGVIGWSTGSHNVGISNLSGPVGRYATANTVFIDVTVVLVRVGSGSWTNPLNVNCQLLLKRGL